MTEEKLKQILEAMAGITYLDWKKLFDEIERHFSVKATRMNNQIQMGGPDEIIPNYKLSHDLL